MQQALFNSEQLASEWAARICSRLEQIGVVGDELEETRIIIQVFTKTAADELSREQAITLPYTSEPLILTAEQGHQIIELFLRGVNHVAKRLRSSGRSWEERKPLLENVAWKLFNLAKLLVGFLYIPNPAMQSLLSNAKDMQLMMKQSADTLLDELTGDRPAGSLPFSIYQTAPPPSYE